MVGELKYTGCQIRRANGDALTMAEIWQVLKELEVMRETLEHLRDRTSCTSTQYEMIDEALDWANAKGQPRAEQT